MNDKDYYAILGVEHDADDAAIRKAFQKLARKYHPDINKEPGAEEKFKEISEAYAVLSDPDKRRRYDAMQSGNPFAGASYGSPSQPQGDPFGGMGGFWGWPFGAAGAGQQAGRAPRHHVPALRRVRRMSRCGFGPCGPRAHVPHVRGLWTHLR